MMAATRTAPPASARAASSSTTRVWRTASTTLLRYASVRAAAFKKAQDSLTPLFFVCLVATLSVGPTEHGTERQPVCRKLDGQLQRPRAGRRRQAATAGAGLRLCHGGVPSARASPGRWATSNNAAQRDATRNEVPSRLTTEPLSFALCPVRFTRS